MIALGIIDAVKLGAIVGFTLDTIVGNSDVDITLGVIVGILDGSCEGFIDGF